MGMHADETSCDPQQDCHMREGRMKCTKHCNDLLGTKPGHLLLSEIECNTSSKECCCTFRHTPRAQVDDERSLG
jgi:hypothetical protein